MLVQVVALLGLGVLGSSAPLQTARPSSTNSQEGNSGSLVGPAIQELLQDISELKLNTVPSVATMNAKAERCMYRHLKTFADTLAAFDIRSKVVAKKLTRVNPYKNILLKDPDEDCETEHVTWHEFLDRLEKLLRLLFQKI